MNIQVVLYTSEFQHPGLLLLLETLKTWGWPKPYVYGGEGRWMGHPWKLQSLRREIPRIKKTTGATHIVFVDAWDTVCCGDLEDVDRRMPLHGAILAAEKICFPDAWRSTDYPDLSLSRWKYVNGGGLAGSIDYIGDVLLSGVEEADCDQRFLTSKYLAPTLHLDVDDECGIFQTLGGCEPWSDTFIVNSSCRPEVVFNKETRTYPVFLHGNARTDMSWLPGCTGGRWQRWWELPNYGIPEKPA